MEERKEEEKARQAHEKYDKSGLTPSGNSPNESPREPEKRVGAEDIERLRSETESRKPRSDYFERAKTLFRGDRKRLLVLAALFVIFVLAFWIRSIPAQYNEIQALDPFYLYRLGQYMLDNDLRLPDVDTFRHHPFGSIPLQDEFSVPIYLPVLSYLVLGQSMPFLQWAIIYPALAGALAVIVMFFIGRELYDYRAGLFAAFFLATIPAFITRTSAGFFDKEPTFGLFMLLTVYFFIAAYRRNSWKLGILAGVFLGVANISSGIGRYIYIFYFLFAMIVLLLNRHKRLLHSYGPTVVLATLIQFLAPKNNIGSTFFYMFVGVLAILLLRYVVERFRLLKEKDIKYFVPGMVVVITIGLLMGTMFSDYLFQLLDGLLSVAFVLNPSPIGYTVAEQQPGNWGSMASLTGLQFYNQNFPHLGPFTETFYLGTLPVHGLLSIFFLMLLGIMMIVLRFAKRVYREKDLRDDEMILVLPLLWVIASMWGVFLFVRLTFLFGPPAALIAGLFAAWGVRKLLDMRGHPRLGGAAKNMPFYVLLVAALLVFVNSVNALNYSSALGPSICITNPQILIDGQKCLEVNDDGSITYAEGQPWYQAMAFLRDLPYPKNVLTWWDFGHWFNARGETPSVSDGGKGPRHETAIWYTAPVSQWDEFIPYLEEYEVTHILQDYTLPGKYGAITAIATDGQGTVGLLQLSQAGTFQEGNTTVQEFTGGGFAFWIPITPAGDLAGSPMFLSSQGGQYVQNGFVNDVCTSQGILRVGDSAPSIGGCLSFSAAGSYYIPESAKNTIFTSLHFMNGSGLPVEKVFDNSLIQIYALNNTQAA